MTLVRLLLFESTISSMSMLQEFLQLILDSIGSPVISLIAITIDLLTVISGL